MEETTLYSDGATLVTSTRFVTGATTYAMAQITSVTAVSAPKPRSTLLWGVLIAVCGLGALAGDVGGIGVMLLLIGGMMVAFYALSKVKHIVQIGTSGGQVQAVVSTDGDAVRKIFEALTQAIVNRR